MLRAHYEDASGRRSSVIYVTAVKGDRRAARGLIGKVLRKTLGVRGWLRAPHYVEYRQESAGYHLDTTEKEFRLVGEAIAQASQEGGWSQPPVDMYRG